MLLVSFVPCHFAACECPSTSSVPMKMNDEEVRILVRAYMYVYHRTERNGERNGTERNHI